MLDNINTGYYGTKGSGKMAQIVTHQILYDNKIG